MAACERDGLLDQPAADPVTPEFGEIGHVKNSPDPGIVEIGINAEAADTRPPAVDRRHQESLTGAREAVDVPFPFFDDAWQESIARGLALGQHVREAIEAEIVQSGDERFPGNALRFSRSLDRRGILVNGMARLGMARAPMAQASLILKSVRSRSHAMSRTGKPKGFGACPSYFFASCREASRGGSNSYQSAAYNLYGGRRGLLPYEVEQEVWVTLLEELQGLVTARCDGEILAWFDRWLPRCMALVPRRRRQSFLKGIYRYDEETEFEWGNAIAMS